jgi:quinol-cytochrome oxidoreductase complex cytochrome b subunit
LIIFLLILPSYLVASFIYDNFAEDYFILFYVLLVFSAQKVDSNITIILFITAFMLANILLYLLKKTKIDLIRASKTASVFYFFSIITLCFLQYSSFKISNEKLQFSLLTGFIVSFVTYLLFFIAANIRKKNKD